MQNYFHNNTAISQYDWLKGKITMSNKPQLYKFSEIEHRLHTLEPGKSYIKPFVTSKVSDTMCGGLNFLN